MTRKNNRVNIKVIDALGANGKPLIIKARISDEVEEVTAGNGRKVKTYRAVWSNKYIKFSERELKKTNGDIPLLVVKENVEIHYIPVSNYPVKNQKGTLGGRPEETPS